MAVFFWRTVLTRSRGRRTSRRQARRLLTPAPIVRPLGSSRSMFVRCERPIGAVGRNDNRAHTHEGSTSVFRTTTWVAVGMFALVECWLMADSAGAGLFGRRCGHHRSGVYASCGGSACHGRAHRRWGGRRHHGGYSRHAVAGCYGPPVTHCHGFGGGPEVYATPGEYGSGTDGDVPGGSPQRPMPPSDATDDGEAYQGDVPEAPSSPSDLDADPDVNGSGTQPPN
jgi:hypothetical protein